MTKKIFKTRSRFRLASTQHAERGSVFMEAVLAVPVLLLIAGGIIDYGLVLRENAVIVSAARAGARAAAGATITDGQNYSDGPNVFLCVLAKQASKKFLSESGLSSDDFRIEATAELIDAGLDEGGSLIELPGIRVTVGHEQPRWFFMWRNATQVSSSNIFATESGSTPDCGGGPP